MYLFKNIQSHKQMVVYHVIFKQQCDWYRYFKLKSICVVEKKKSTHSKFHWIIQQNKFKKLYSIIIENISLYSILNYAALFYGDLILFFF